MKLFLSELRLLAITLVLCAATLTAQEQPSSAPHNELVQATLSPATAIFDTAEYRYTSLFDPNAVRYPHNLAFEFAQTPTPPKTGKTPEKIKRAPVDPSMVGYIDDAVVHSEVRIRFDAALHDDTPDRAEFFYAKCGCYRTAPTNSPNYDPNSPGPGNTIPSYVNFQQLYFYGEYAATPQFSLFTQLPVRWLQPKPSGAAQAFPNGSGFGDMSIGFKLAAIATPRSYLTFQFRLNLPSGDARQGLGTNHVSAEPALLYYQRISDRLSVEGQLLGTMPLTSSAGLPTASTEGFAGNVFSYGIGPSYKLIDHEQYKLAGVIELVGWNVGGGQATNRTSTAGVNIVNIKVGPRVLFGRNSIYFGYGIALTSQTWYREIFRTEYRYSF